LELPGETPSTIPENQPIEIPSLEPPSTESEGVIPESDDLLNWLMTSLNETPHTLPFFRNDFLMQTTTANPSLGRPTASKQGVPPAKNRLVETDLQQLFDLIEDVTKRLNSDFDHTCITSDFLEICLHEFSKRVLPLFPVIHEPTFSSQKSIAPLLLNMIALGSLFVCLPGALQKGEVIWKLAHTAVMASWHNLVNFRAPHDNCAGLQLVLTALFGQTYALLTNNTNIRATAFVFHGLGFYWARICGMYSSVSQELQPIPSLDMPSSEKDALWKSWASSEVQRRAILGHYILDGLISETFGSPASTRHLVNRLNVTCSDAAFAAKSADEWILKMAHAPELKFTISEVYASIFSSHYVETPLLLSSFTISVVIEGLQSLISDIEEVGEFAFGMVTKPQIMQALMNLHQGNISTLLATNERNALSVLIRWHTVCMEVAAPSASIYSTICDEFEVPHELLGMTSKVPGMKFNAKEWAKSPNAVRAVLHAIAIIQILEDIPASQSHAFHFPAAIFASSVILSGMCLFGLKDMEIPAAPFWQHVWVPVLPGTGTEGISAQFWNGDDLLRFLYSSGTGVTSSVNLLNQINILQLLVRTIASRWTISKKMEAIVSHLSVLSHERQMLVS
jgi:hypothetical protein